MPKRKYFVNSGVLDRHYNPEFMKQVLPRLPRPTAPLRDLAKSISLMSFLARAVTLIYELRPGDKSTVSASVVSLVCCDSVDSYLKTQF